MKFYRVNMGMVAKVGAGEDLSLAGQQIRDRAQYLDLPAGYQIRAKDPRKEKPPVAMPAVVRSRAPLDFKGGEIIGMAEMPRNLAGFLEPVDAPADAVMQVRDLPPPVAKEKKAPAPKRTNDRSRRGSDGRHPTAKRAAAK